MLFNNEEGECLFMDLSSTSDEDSSEEQDKPGAVDLPHDFSLVSQPVQLTPIRTSSLNPDDNDDEDEQDLFFISDDADSVSSCSPTWLHDNRFVVEGPRKRFKRGDVYVSPVSVCTIVAQPFHAFCATSSPPPPPPLLQTSSNEEASEPDTNSRFYQQLAILSQRMRQSEESRQKVTEQRQMLAHVYESVTSPEASLFTTSKIASDYNESRKELLSSLYQVMTVE